MQHLEVSGAVRHIYIYIVRQLKVNLINAALFSSSVTTHNLRIRKRRQCLFRLTCSPPACYQHTFKFPFFTFFPSLTSGTQHLTKEVLHTARSNASSFNLQSTLTSLRAPSGFLTSSSSSSRHDYLSLYLSFNNVFWKAVPLHKM